MTTFGDARLHISVRPALEYTLPAAGARVRDALLGDATTLEAVEALQQCLPAEEAEGPGGVRPKVGADDEESSQRRKADEADTTSSHAELHLETRCARVCSHAHEYLQDLASRWAEHLTKAHVTVRRAVRRLGAERAEAHRVHARYRASNAEVVDQELRMELARLRVELDRTLERARAEALPSCERPAALTEATHELREAFANAYGTMPTRDLLALKRRFEADVAVVEQRLAQTFVARVAKLLRTSA